LQESIGHDLAVAEVYPKLFLPGLSGLTQEPGFPNLSSSACCRTECWAPT
jgi:mycobactin lysine-N-oxygenase